jgi:hypothetical protein
LATVPSQAQRRGANDAEDDSEDDATGTEWRGDRCAVRGVTENEGRDAEEDIDNRCRDECVAGDETERVIDREDEIAEGPEKQKDRRMQEYVCPVHEPPHLEYLKALK